MEKINKNYIYIAVIVIIAIGLYLLQTRDNNDLSLEVIDDIPRSEEVEVSDLTASVLESATPEKQKMMTLQVYFPNSNMIINKETNCREVFPVKRSVVETIAPARVSLLELFKGPTAEEEKLGFSNSISQDVKIQKLTIEGGMALVDVSALTTEKSNQCDIEQAYKEISKTLKQFSTVDKVSISINGGEEKSF